MGIDQGSPDQFNLLMVKSSMDTKAEDHCNKDLLECRCNTGVYSVISGFASWFTQVIGLQHKEPNLNFLQRPYILDISMFFPCSCRVYPCNLRANRLLTRLALVYKLAAHKARQIYQVLLQIFMEISLLIFYEKRQPLIFFGLKGKNI